MATFRGFNKRITKLPSPISESAATVSRNTVALSPSSINQTMVESRVSKTAKSDSSDRRDRLSKLPDCLILKIISSLEMGEVVRTSILSKRWKDLWITVPCLDFSHHRSYRERSSSLEAHRNFIRGALARWNGDKILKFSIVDDLDPCETSSSGDDDDDDGSEETSSDDDESFESDSDFDASETVRDIDSWLLLAIGKQVEELSIDLGFFSDRLFPKDREYRGPKRLFSCSSITKLSFSQCRLKVGRNVQWNQLKSLTINGSESWSEAAMDRVFSGAPQLEEFNLCVKEINDNLTIRSRSLKKLNIGDDWSYYEISVNGELTIWAPNLISLEISACVYGACLLEVPSLTNVLLYFHSTENVMKTGDFSAFEMLDQVFPSISHVQKVTFADWCIKFLLFMKENDMPVVFSKATQLEIYAGEVSDGRPEKRPKLKMSEMLDVLEMFPKLKKLIAQLDEDEMRLVFEEPETAFPNSSLHQLKTADITWCLRDASTVPAIEIMLENAHLLETMVLRLKLYRVTTRKFISAKRKLRKMPISSSTAQLTIIKVDK